MDLGHALVAVAFAGGGAMLLGAGFKWMHRRYVDPLPFPNKELAGHVHQLRILTIDCGPDKAIVAARDAVLSLPKTRLLRMAGRKLDARTGMGWRSLSEVIAISAQALGDGGSSLSIASRPRYADTTMDFGKGYENVERVVAHLARTHAVSLSRAMASPQPLARDGG